MDKTEYKYQYKYLGASGCGVGLIIAFNIGVFLWEFLVNKSLHWYWLVPAGVLALSFTVARQLEEEGPGTESCFEYLIHIISTWTLKISSVLVVAALAIISFFYIADELKSVVSSDMSQLKLIGSIIIVLLVVVIVKLNQNRNHR